MIVGVKKLSERSKMINDFSDFVEKFWKWEANLEIPTDRSWPACPYARAARLENKVELIDAREDMNKISDFDRNMDIGIAWLGDEIDLEKKRAQLDVLRKKNPDLDLMISRPGGRASLAPNFTNTVVIHRSDDLLKRRRALYEAGYYQDYPEGIHRERMDEMFSNVKELYPIKKQKNQSIGTPSVGKIFSEFAGTGSVLDIGGSAGNLLELEKDKITDYACVEVSAKAVALGKKIYPMAKFFHYNKKNWMYNFSGKSDAQFPDVDKNYDYVFVNSVFTSTDYQDLIEIIHNVKGRCNKKIVFTVFDKNNTELLTLLTNNQITKKWKDQKNNIFYLINNSLEIYDQNRLNQDTVESCDSFVTAYNIDWLKHQLEKEFINYTFVVNQDFDKNFTVFTIEKTKALTISKDWYLNLDQHLPIESIPDIKDAIVDSFDKINYNCYGTTFGLDGSKINDTNLAKDKPLRYTGNQRFFEMEIKYGVRAPFWVLNLTQYTGENEPKTFDSIKIPQSEWEKVQWRTDLTLSWQPLIKWIDRLAVFKHRGRVGVFLDRPGVPSEFHNDSGKVFGEGFESYPHREEFIWFNLSPEKNFYILDNQRKPIKIKSRSAFWNHHNDHGRHESLQHWTFSFKVEGVFTEEFRKQVGISHLENYYYEE